MSTQKTFQSKSERRGCLLLLCILLCVIEGLYVLYVSKPIVNSTLSLKEQKELERFEAQIRSDSLQRANAAQPKRNEEALASEELFVFDPNTADSFTLVRLGLHPWQAKAMINYRKKGGRWKTVEDFRRLYGLTESVYQRLKPYIRIAPSELELQKIARLAKFDSIAKLRHYPTKLKKGEQIDLNTADTTLFKQIPGIGSYYAKKICRYREALGGFISLAQIKEVPDLPGDIEEWLVISHQPVRRISVNKATFKELVRHPYLNYEQVKEIVNYIRENGPLHSWQELRFSPHFSPTDFERLKPYFHF